MDPETTTAQETTGTPDLADLLSKFPDAPNTSAREALKQEHGEIFCSGFSETELFIFRPVTWGEHKNFQKKLVTPVEGQEPMTEFDYQEMIVATCLLWTSVKNLSQKGGSIPTLFEQIMQNSNFISPQIASQFVVKL